MSVCSLEGDTAELIMDLSFHRYLFKPTRISGTIYLNNVEFISAKLYQSYNIFNNLKDKLLGYYQPLLFVLPSDDPLSQTQNGLYFFLFLFKWQYAPYFIYILF